MQENLFFDLHCKKGLEMAVEETKNFDRIIKGVYELTAKEVYGSVNTSGVAAFAYGSPGRIELIGGDSDADVILFEEKRTEKSIKLRELLKKRWGAFDFSKVDLPTWGTYNEIDTYISKSLVEGNQILETRFLIGDHKVKEEVELRIKKFNSIDRELTNIFFNRLYLNQYFKQRVRDGNLNVKYCSGGSRDFLFFSWKDRLNELIKKENIPDIYEPKIKTSLNNLANEGKISKEDLSATLEAIDFSISLRANILKINKDNGDRGLTFLDDLTLNKLNSMGYPPPQIIRDTFEKYRLKIEEISKIILEDSIEKAGKMYNPKWKDNFKLAFSAKTPEYIRSKINFDDPHTPIALIWGASESNQINLFNSLAEKYKNTFDWAIIGSLVCSPLCNSEILHHFGTGQLKEEGYGYLLRVVARNKNVKRDTLESIANDSSLEKRYTEVAQAAILGGNASANNQI